jgi:hypothetical protein
MTHLRSLPQRHPAREGIAWHHVQWRPMSAPPAATIRALDVSERSRFEIGVDGERASVRGYVARHSQDYLDPISGDLPDASELDADA